MPDIFDPIAWTVARRLGGGNSGGGVAIKNQDKTITENGTYKADSGYTGLGTVSVNVPSKEPVLQDKTITENGTVLPDVGYDGMSKVVVDVPGIVPSGTIDITENGSYDVTNFATALVEIAASGGGSAPIAVTERTPGTNGSSGVTSVPLDFVPNLVIFWGPLSSGSASNIGLAIHYEKADGTVYQRKCRYQSSKYLIGTEVTDGSLLTVIQQSDRMVRVNINPSETSYGNAFATGTLLCARV